MEKKLRAFVDFVDEMQKKIETLRGQEDKAAELQSAKNSFKIIQDEIERMQKQKTTLPSEPT